MLSYGIIADEMGICESVLVLNGCVDIRICTKGNLRYVKFKIGDSMSSFEWRSLCMTIVKSR